uniref:Rho-GAP domain-containing protein n=1 Tax=Astyanax mexicanus TaxID=7994 RepID=A0A8B9JIX1_ASTMX
IKTNKQQKSKRKGSENAFGCDLTEHLQSSGLEVPHVLKTCAEFIEKHGIVDGIYRLSGITSNIQRLR